ncbi:4910_t:CDS:1, partial [Ambispora gerdemannii]
MDDEQEESDKNETYQANTAFIESEKSLELQEAENILSDSSNDQELESIIVFD